MRQYIEHLRNEKTPHERRAFAMRIAGVLTAMVFVVWITTLGFRLSDYNTDVANRAHSNQAAATLVAVQGASSTPTY